MHETTHAWQYQLGYWIKWHALWVTSRGTAAYEYSLKHGRELQDYNMEQQGKTVSEYLMICVKKDPEPVRNKRRKYNDPALTKSTIKNLLKNPSDEENLPK